MRLSVILVGLVLALAVLASGCGGGSGSGEGGSSTAGSSSASGTEADGTEADGKGKEAEGKSTEAEGKKEEGPAVNEEAVGGGEKGKEGKEGKEEPSSAKAAFIEEGDAICNQIPVHYNTALQKLEKEAGKKKVSKAEGNLKAAVPPLYTAAGELQALTPPAGEEEQVEAIIAALEGAAKGLEAKPESELGGPNSPFAEFETLSGEFGFKICSQL